MPTSPAEQPGEPHAVGLEVTGLVTGYGSTTIVHGMDLEVGPGEAVGIVGPNGAGKSTFLKAVAGVIPAKDGTVRLDGVEVTNLRGDQLARLGLGYVPQVNDVFSPLSVQENLEMGGYILPRKEVPQRVEEIFTTFSILKKMRKRAARTLSGGERKLLAIGRLLMTRPKVLLLDEPTANLSPDLARVVLTEHVRALVDSGIAVVLVEQRAVEGLKVCDRAYVMAAGVVQLSGRSSDVLANEDIGALFLGRRPGSSLPGRDSRLGPDGVVPEALARPSGSQ